MIRSLALLALAAGLSACTTLENRRDLYFPQTVEGPYTRMLKDGIKRKVTVVETVEVTTTGGKNVIGR